MAVSRSFKVPSVVPQDLAIIMELVDPPSSQKKELVGRHKHKGSSNIISKSVINSDDDISSSCTESEDEVEAEIALSLKTDGTIKTVSSSVRISSEEDSYSQSSGSESSSSSETSFCPKSRTNKQREPSIIDVDAIEDGASTAATYLPTTHEIPPSDIPVPSLPDPSTLPQEALELVGEIVTISPDNLTIRGGSVSSSSARERRNAVLDEGSLLLLDDRTPLGYVSETFGPTTLPHYLVRVKRRESTRNTSSASHSSTNGFLDPVQDQTVSNVGDNPQSALSPSSPSTSSPHDYLDPTRIFVSRAVYHIPSLSEFVFPTALAHLKGSDASNLHDEEIAEHEQEFSDDEVEAMHKRLRRGLSSRSPPVPPFGDTFDGECDDSISVAPDEASSLYGASPYDVEDGSSRYKQKDHVPSSQSYSDSPGPSLSLINFEDAAVQDALTLVRNSRHRRHASVSVSEASFAAGPSRTREQDHQSHSRGRRGSRARGKDRNRSERGRERNFRGHVRGRGHRRGPGATPEIHDGEHMLSGNRRSSFSFEEYDPHMPRPPSPTSLAIARATGQWIDGTPFPYNLGVTSGGSAIVADAHVAQTDLQGHVSMNYPPETYGNQGYYGSTVALPQTLGYHPFPAENYGVVPHINPRFAQAFQLPNSSQGSSVTPQTSSLDASNPYSHSKHSETEPGFQSND